MKLTVKRQAFQKILETAYDAIPSATTEPAFKNFLIKIEENQVSVLASNDDFSIKNVLSTEGEDSPIINSEVGSVQIPAKYLLDIVKNLQSDIVSLNLVDSSILLVSDERSNFNLNVMRAEDYPEIDLVSSSKEIIQIKPGEFNSLYQATSFAVASNGPKELFKGINISVKEGKLTFVATDSFRLARKYIPIEGEHHVSITVPSKTLQVVSKLSSEKEVILIVDVAKVLFQIGNTTISSKLYNGEFPNVERIIPVDIRYELEVNSKEFIAAVDRITIVGNTKILVTHIGDKIKLSSKDVNIGSSDEELSNAVFRGENFSIVFNANYVTDAIKALNSDRVNLSFCGENRAFLVKSDDETITQVITPIRSLDNN